MLCGGASLFGDLAETLQSKVPSCLQEHLEIQIPARPQLSVWRGGVALSSLSTFHAMSVTREEFFEQGLERVELQFV